MQEVVDSTAGLCRSELWLTQLRPVASSSDTSGFRTFIPPTFISPSGNDHRKLPTYSPHTPTVSGTTWKTVAFSVILQHTDLSVLINHTLQAKRNHRKILGSGAGCVSSDKKIFLKKPYAPFLKSLHVRPGAHWHHSSNI